MVLRLRISGFILWLCIICQIQAQDYEKNAAFKIRTTNKGLNFISRVAKNMLMDFLKDGSGHTLETKSKDVTLKWTNLKVEQFNDEIKSDVVFSPGIGVEYKLREFAAKLTSDYEVVQSDSSKDTPASGELLVTMNKVAVSLLLSMLNSGGYFKPALEDCLCKVADADLKVTKGSAEDLNKHFKEDVINNEAKSFLQEQICEFARSIFLPEIEHTFAGFPIHQKIFSHVYYNYSLTEDPTVTSDNIITSYAGNAYIHHKRSPNDSQVPFAAPRIADAPCPDRMMCLFMSNYSLRSLIYFMGKEHRFDYNFTQKSTPSFAKYLRTQCTKEEICAGSVIQSLPQKYPNSSLEIFIKEIPGKEVITIKKDIVNMTGEGIVTGYVVKNNGQKEWLFTCNEESYTTMRKPVFNAANYSVSTVLDANHFRLYNVSSSDPEVNAESLSLLTGFSMDNYVTPDLYKSLGRALRLPKLIEFPLVNGYAAFENDVIVMASDFCITPEECKEVEQAANVENSKNAKPDYEAAYEAN